MLFSKNAKQALTAWQQARNGKTYPLASQFGPLQMREFLPYVGMFRKEAGGTFRVTLVGTALAEAFAFDPTGLEVKELYSEADLPQILEMYDLIFPGHFISHSQRAYMRKSGVRMVVEQLLLPIGNEAGDHDRYVFIADNVPVPHSEAGKANSELVLGELQLRTVYDPATMLPVECSLTTPRSPEEMQRRLTDYKPSA